MSSERLLHLGELEIGGHAVGALAGWEELANGVRRASSAVNKHSAGVAHLPAGGASAPVGPGFAANRLAVGSSLGSSEGGHDSDDSSGELHDVWWVCLKKSWNRD